jgi:MFS family permease
VTSRRQAGVVAALGAAQTLAWASSYYLPAVLAAPMARDLGLATSTVFAAFSAALLVSALAGPVAGRAIDRLGGRSVLVATSLVFAAGLGLLAASTSTAAMLAGWLVIGLAMGAGLYEAAFSTLVGLYGHDARRAITGVTLVAGFASTIGWPLSALLEAHVGWRGAIAAWAALHLALGLPLNAWLPRSAARAPAPIAPAAVAPAPNAGPSRGATALLSFVFAATWFVSTAMAAHLPARGATGCARGF